MRPLWLCALVISTCWLVPSSYSQRSEGCPEGSVELWRETLDNKLRIYCGDEEQKQEIERTFNAELKLGQLAQQANAAGDAELSKGLRAARAEIEKTTIEGLRQNEHYAG